MNIPQTSKEQLLEVLQSAEEARNTELLAPVLADLAADRQHERSTDWKSLVIEEAIVLADRLEYLEQHPKLPVFLGGCAVKVNSWNGRKDRVLSEPVMSIESELFTHQSVKSSLRFGYTSIVHSGKPHNLYVHNVVQEDETGVEKQDTLYEITANKTEPEYSDRTVVDGKEFREFRYAMQHDLYETYAAENPWMEDFKVMGYGQKDHLTVVPFKSPMLPRAQQRMLDHQRRIEEELIPQLKPGDSWDYPDRLYLLPLGMLIQANRIFGTKQL